MKLPRFIASTPAQGTGLVRANDIGALTRTGGGAEFGAMANIGGAISQAGDMVSKTAMTRKALDNEAAAGIADSRSEDALNEAVVSISGMDLSLNRTYPNNPKEYYDGSKALDWTTEDSRRSRDDQYKAYEGKIETLSKAVGFRGEQARLRWKSQRLTNGYASISKTANAKQQEFQQELYLNNAKTAASNGDLDVANEWIDMAQKAGLINSNKADKARKDAVVENITHTYRNGEYDEARKLLEESLLTATEKESLEDTIDTDEKAISASNKLNSEAAIDAELQVIDDVFILPPDKFLESVTEILKKINDSETLPVKGKNGRDKEGQRKKIKNRIKALNEGKIDPVLEYDTNYYDLLSRRIANNPRSVTEPEINAAAGNGKDKGITAGKTGQQGELLRLKRFLQDDEAQGELYKGYSEKLASLKAAKIFHQTRKRSDILASEARILLNSWAKDGVRTIQDYETFFEGLVESIGASSLEPETGYWFSSKASEQKQRSEAMAEYAAGLDDSGGRKTEYKKGDTKIIHGRTWTFDGKEWND